MLCTIPNTANKIPVTIRVPPLITREFNFRIKRPKTNPPIIPMIPAGDAYANKAFSSHPCSFAKAAGNRFCPSVVNAA